MHGVHSQAVDAEHGMGEYLEVWVAQLQMGSFRGL